MKTIVAPVDFTGISVNAAEYAADFAAAIRGELALVHFCPIPVSYGEVPAPVYNMDEMMSDAGILLSELTEKLRERVNGQAKITSEVRQGAVTPGVDDFCAITKPFAVVMGAESAGAFERLLFGANTVNAIRQISWPLIIVPSDCRFSGIRRIGLACDLHNVAETVPFREIEGLLRQFNAELHILYVTGGNPANADDRTIAEASWLQAMFADFHPKYDFLKNGKVEEAILDFADRNSLDLLIVIPKKHNLITKIFQYSHSKRLVLHARLPLLAIRE
jgi:nucleotide-binding universal stress UspA family protein